VNQSIAVVSCRVCGRRFVVDVDEIPVAFDRGTGDPALICDRCRAEAVE
jgi:hypothetical protein